MTRLLPIMAVLSVVATPAFAQSSARRIAHDLIDGGITHAAPSTVYEGGIYAGTDPDPNIRLQLLRDAVPRHQ